MTPSRLQVFVAASLSLLATSASCSKQATPSETPASKEEADVAVAVTVPADFGKTVPEGIFAVGYVAGSDNMLNSPEIQELLTASGGDTLKRETNAAAKYLALDTPFHAIASVRKVEDKINFYAACSFRAATIESLEVLFGKKVMDEPAGALHSVRRIHGGTPERPIVCDIWPTQQPQIACAAGETAEASLAELGAYAAFGVSARPQKSQPWEFYAHFDPEPLRNIARPMLAMASAGSSLVEQFLPESIPEPARSVLARGATMTMQEVLAISLTLKQLEYVVTPDPENHGIKQNVRVDFEGNNSKFVSYYHAIGLAGGANGPDPYVNLPTATSSAMWQRASTIPSPMYAIVDYLAELGDAGMLFGNYRPATRKKVTGLLRWFGGTHSASASTFVAPVRPRPEDAPFTAKLSATMALTPMTGEIKCPSLAAIPSLLADPATAKLWEKAGETASDALKNAFKPVRVRGLPKATTSQSFLRVNLPSENELTNSYTPYFEVANGKLDGYCGCFSTKTHLFFVTAPTLEDLQFHATRLVEPNPGPAVLSRPELKWLDEQGAGSYAGFRTTMSLAQTLHSALAKLLAENSAFAAAMAELHSADIAIMQAATFSAKDAVTTIELRALFTANFMASASRAIVAAKKAYDASEAEKAKAPPTPSPSSDSDESSEAAAQDATR